MFICYIYRHLCFDNVYMPIKNLNLKKNLNLNTLEPQVIAGISLFKVLTRLTRDKMDKLCRNDF